MTIPSLGSSEQSAGSLIRRTPTVARGPELQLQGNVTPDDVAGEQSGRRLQIVTQRDRVLALLADGPMRSLDVSDVSGITSRQVSAVLSQLATLGKVVCLGKAPAWTGSCQGNPQMWGLPGMSIAVQRPASEHEPPTRAKSSPKSDLSAADIDRLHAENLAQIKRLRLFRIDPYARHDREHTVRIGI